MDIRERCSSRLSCVQYIQKIRQFRNEGRNKVYTDMACTFTHHTICEEEDIEISQKIMEDVGADNRNDKRSASVENALLIFLSSKEYFSIHMIVFKSNFLNQQEVKAVITRMKKISKTSSIANYWQVSHLVVFSYSNLQNVKIS